MYGAFSEDIMRDFYGKLANGDDLTLAECAPEICRRLDALLVGRLWKDGNQSGKRKQSAACEKK